MRLTDLRAFACVRLVRPAAAAPQRPNLPDAVKAHVKVLLREMAKRIQSGDDDSDDDDE